MYECYRKEEGISRKIRGRGRKEKKTTDEHG